MAPRNPRGRPPLPRAPSTSAPNRQDAIRIKYVAPSTIESDQTGHLRAEGRKRRGEVVIETNIEAVSAMPHGLRGKRQRVPIRPSRATAQPSSEPITPDRDTLRVHREYIDETQEPDDRSIQTYSPPDAPEDEDFEFIPAAHEDSSADSDIDDGVDLLRDQEHLESDSEEEEDDDDDDMVHIEVDEVTNLPIERQRTVFAERMVKFMESGIFKGCGAQLHQKALDEHLLVARGNHYTLRSTYAKFPKPYPIHGVAAPQTFCCRAQGAHEYGLSAPGLPKSKSDLVRPDLPSSKRLRQTFEGVRSDGLHTMNICLHEELDRRGTTPMIDVVYDIDSFMLIIRNMRAIRRGFFICMCYVAGRQIESDLHFEVTINSSVPGIPKQLQIRDIPHLYIGQLDGFKDAPMYLVCPRLYEPNRATTYLTLEQRTLFFQDVLLPLIKRYYPAGITQYQPGSFEDASVKASAHNEERLRDQVHQAKQSSFFLGSEHLGPMWDAVQHVFHNRSLQQFADSFIFVNVKGTKSQWPQPTILRSIHMFQDQLHTSINTSYLDEGLFDIGVEAVPRYPVLDTSPSTSLLWRTCCLHATCDAFRKDFFSNSKGRSAIYSIGFLRDAANITLTPPKKSWAAQVGFSYLQMYSVTKTICDAQGTYLFNFDEMVNLSTDPATFKSATSTAKTRDKDWDRIKRCYDDAKHRTGTSYQHSGHKPIACRGEVRIKLALFNAIISYLTHRDDGTDDDRGYGSDNDSIAAQTAHSVSSNDPDSSGSSKDGNSSHGDDPGDRHDESAQGSPGPPQPYPNTADVLEATWPLQTEEFCRFIFMTYHKFCGLADMASLTASPTGTSLSTSQLIGVAIRALKRTTNFRLGGGEEGCLWLDKKVVEDGRTILRGVGMEKTIQAHGFGWFTSIVDWENLAMKLGKSERICGLENLLRRHYDTRKKSRLLVDSNQQMYEHTEEVKSCTKARLNQLMEHMMNICFVQYRRDVLDSLKGEIRRSDDDDDVDAAEDNFMSWDGIQATFTTTPTLLAQHRSTYSTPDEMFDLLWSDQSRSRGLNRSGTTVTFNRKRWENKPYRQLYRKCCRAMEGRGQDCYAEWQSRFEQAFWREHWIVNYPNKTGSFVQKATKLKDAYGDSCRVWWQVKETMPGVFAWARAEEPRKGRPGLTSGNMLPRSSKTIVRSLMFETISQDMGFI